MIRIKAIDQLREATVNGCSFITFLYETKGTQEVAKYRINFGVDYRNTVAHDKAALEQYTPENELEAEAKEQMLKSLTETLVDGVSSAYTQKDAFESIGKGIKQHNETGELYIWGYVESKEQVEEPKNPKAPVKSRPLTLAKKKIEKACNFKRVKFGQFILSQEHIGGIVVKGEVVEIHR